MFYVADFETVNDENDCRVWAWGLMASDTKKFTWGTTIEGFFEETKLHESCTIYFHNLAFDGDFLMYPLLKNMQHTTEKKLLDGEFKTCISEQGQFYFIDICHKTGKHAKRVKVLDSFKLLQCKVEEIPKNYGLDYIEKGTIDYNKPRPTGYLPDNEEIQYLKDDCEIVIDGLKKFFQYGKDKITIGSCALADYKDTIGKRGFNILFPQIECDAELRPAYKGGISILNPEFANKILYGGLVFDVNSLYPSVMHDKYLPWGTPVFFENKYQHDEKYPLFVQQISCNFEIKNGFMPTIQIKNDLRFSPREYLRSSNGETVVLSLTNIELPIFFEHYEVYNLEYISGYKFKQSKTMFKKYVEKWSDRKINAKANKNDALYTVSKHFMNDLYGKFGTNPKRKNKIPILLSENEKVKYETVVGEDAKLVYLPVAIFITSYARSILIAAAQANYARFIYGDTDSVHLYGTDPPQGFEVDNYKLGAWKCELIVTRGKYLAQKCYIEEGHEPDSDKIITKVTVAGMPKTVHKHVNFENFAIGTTYKGKLKKKRVNGGTILFEDFHTVRERASRF